MRSLNEGVEEERKSKGLAVNSSMDLLIDSSSILTVCTSQQELDCMDQDNTLSQVTIILIAHNQNPHGM